MDFRKIKNEAKDALVGKRLMFLLAIIIVGLITGLGSYALGLGIIVAGTLQIGLYYTSVELLKGKDIDFNVFVKPFKNLNNVVKFLV